MSVLVLKDPQNFRQRYLLPALSDHWIEMTQPESPQSPAVVNLLGVLWLCFAKFF